MDFIRSLEIEHMKKELPGFSIGDTVRVSYKIREGSKERIQVFEGTVIAVRGSGIRRTMKVRRIVAGEGVERTFPLHSPKLADVKVTRMGRARRAKLYYLRQRVGKATRVKQAFGKVAASKRQISPRGTKSSSHSEPQAKGSAENESKEPVQSGAE